MLGVRMHATADGDPSTPIDPAAPAFPATIPRHSGGALVGRDGDVARVLVALSRTDARIVSVNSQYIVGDVDWSPDGTRLAYIMATLPSLRGLELFVSEGEAIAAPPGSDAGSSVRVPARD